MGCNDDIFTLQQPRKDLLLEIRNGAFADNLRPWPESQYPDVKLPVVPSETLQRRLVEEHPSYGARCGLARLRTNNKTSDVLIIETGGSLVLRD